MKMVNIDKKVAGYPVKIGTSQGGMHAFMAGICYVTVGGKRYERPVVFLRPAGNPVSSNPTPSPEELLSIDQLTRYSQPKIWQWDEGALNQALKQTVPV